jgi:hypothetical protein
MSNGILPPFSAGLSFALFQNSSKTLPLAIVNSSGQVINWNAVADSGAANWLSLDRNSGSLQAHEVQTIYATAQSGQTIGDFSGTLTFTPSVGTVEALTAVLHVSQGVFTDNGPKAPQVIRSFIDFVAQLVGSSVQVQSNPSSLQFVNTESDKVQWTMTSMVSWLTLNDITGIPQVGGQKITGTWSNGGEQLKVNVTVAQNSLSKSRTYRTDIVLTLKFTAPAKANLEPTSILIPVTVTVP